MQHLRLEGFEIGRYKTRSLMNKLGLVVKQRRKSPYRSSKPKTEAQNELNQRFNPESVNQAWAGDVTYLRTVEGWCCLAVVMDLHSRRVIGWRIQAVQNTNLVLEALRMAINLRKPTEPLLFHSDQGAQYLAKAFQNYLAEQSITPSISQKGACWDNAVVERFFGSLKNEWLLNRKHLRRETMKQDVEAYIKYYNHKRLHSYLNQQTPIQFES